MNDEQPTDRLPVKSLGVLSLGEISPNFALHRQELIDLSGRIKGEDRERVVRYLRGGTIIFAAMEYTIDVISNAFGRPGGSGIRTDGDYYWRGDCADYVQHYGVGLPNDFLRHMERLEWTTPVVSPERALEIDRYLMGLKKPRSGLPSELA